MDHSRADILAFAIGALTPMALVIIAWVWKVGKELLNQTPEEREGSGSWFLASFGLLSLLVTCLPFGIALGVACVIVRHAVVWLSARL